LGNFLFISLIIIYISQALYKNDKRNRFFLITLILIVLFDVLVIGFYFGSEKLLQRFLFLQNEVMEYLPLQNEIKEFLPYSVRDDISRAALSKFAFIEFKKFIIFGYGGGGFEYLFKINFQNLSTSYATHAHSDLMEFLGEFGLIGSTLVILTVLFIFTKNYNFCFKNILLFYLLFFILIFDFSLHIPIIQLLFILLLSVNYNKSYILS
jgi:O-antigen ligase